MMDETTLELIRGVQALADTVFERGKFTGRAELAQEIVALHDNHQSYWTIINHVLTTGVRK